MGLQFEEVGVDEVLSSFFMSSGRLTFFTFAHDTSLSARCGEKSMEHQD